MLFLDGVYIEDKYGTSRFRRVKAPTSDELSRLTHTIAHRVGRYLERRGLLERDASNTYLTLGALSAPCHWRGTVYLIPEVLSSFLRKIKFPLIFI